MKLKAKKFSRKLLALVLALVMGITCFSGTFSAFASSSTTNYSDGDVEYNGIAWSVLSNEQVCTAVLDYADEMLGLYGEGFEKSIATMINSNRDINQYLKYNLANRDLSISYSIINVGSVHITLDSVNGIINTINSANSLLTTGAVDALSGLFGNLKDIDLSAMVGMSRENNTSCEIVQGVFGLIQKNIVEWNNRNNGDLLGTLLQGKFSLGALDSAIFGDKGLYGTLAGLFGSVPDGYESNLVYNIVKALIFDLTEWFTPEEKLAYNGGGTLTLEDGSTKQVAAKAFVFDDVLLDKMTTELLDKINVLVTYPNEVVAIETNPDSENYGQPSLDANGKKQYVNDSSAMRRTRIDLYMKANPSASWADACAALTASEGVTYDANLKYSDENRGNVILFAYGDDMIKLVKEDSLFSFGFQALDFAWKTVLKDTVNLVRVNNNVDRGHGSNFDNVYYYWARSINDATGQPNVAWVNDITDPAFANNYAEANIQAWAESAYEAYHATSADEFLGWVKNNYEFDRIGDPDSTGEWDDLDATTMFNKIRYSPLADYGFNMQTGPINLYFMQTGVKNLEAFFADEALIKTTGPDGKVTYTNYTSLVDGLNNCLVAAVKDIFVDRDNIYYAQPGDRTVPTMDTTAKGATTATIAATLVGNAAKVIQYTADTMDQNVLKKFYTNHPDGTLSEDNIEEAMMPLLMSLIGQINLNGYKLSECIHPEDWDRCNDAEALVFLCLREYLSYVLPDKDYNVLVNLNDTSISAKADIDKDGKTTMLNDAILVMARDAVAYVMQGYVPFNGKDNQPWYPDTREITDPTTIFDILNSVVCYYAGDYTWKNTTKGEREKALGLAALLGICDESGASLIKESNDLWTNFDIVLNHFFPLAGVLTGEGEGKFSSYSLVWNKIVEGILDIGPNKGITTFIDTLLSIISAEPIKDTPIILSVYDVLEQLLNAIFGPRYSGQSYVPIPERSSAHPFDDFLQIGVIAGNTDNKTAGVIQKALSNLVEFSGYGSSSVNTYPDTLLPGLTFAVTAVNSFVHFLPALDEHSLAVPSADFETDVQGGVTGSFSSKLNVKNMCSGINLAYVDRSKPEGQQVTQLSRYYIKLTNAYIEGPGSGTISGFQAGKILAPGEEYQVTTSTTISGEESLYKATFEYDIVAKNADGSYRDVDTGLKVTTYQYLSNKADWKTTVYSREDTATGGSYQFPTSAEHSASSGTPSGSTYAGDYEIKLTKSDILYIEYPAYVVATTEDPADVDKYGARIINKTGFALGGTDKSCDGVFYYDSKTVHDAYTNADVTVNQENPKAYCDPETGGIIAIGTFDYSKDGGNTWDRGSGGYSSSDVQKIYDEATQAEKDNFKRRDHVVYTLQEASDMGILKAAVKNDKDLYELVYLKQGSSTDGNPAKMDRLLQSGISLMGPMKGFVVINNDDNRGVNIKRNGSKYTRFIAYDGITPTSDMKTGEYVTANLAWARAGQYGTGSYQFIVVDKDTSSVNTLVADAQAVLNKYRESDFATKTPSVTETAEKAINYALAAIGAPITATDRYGNEGNADKIGDVLERRNVTKVVTSEQGDPAYIPYVAPNGDATVCPEGMPTSIWSESYLNSTNNVYYYDEECTATMYTTTRLTGLNAAGNTVTSGDKVYDKAGRELVLGSDNRYYYKNTPHLDSEWDTTSFDAPLMSSIGKGQKTETDNYGNVTKYYDEVQFVYYNANGDKVTSQSTWVCKVAESAYQMKQITSTAADYRGAVSKATDYLNYAIEELQTSLKPEISLPLVNDISIVRNGMNVTNFDVLTYNKLVEAGQRAEANYTLDITYTTTQNVKDAEGKDVIGEDGQVVTEEVQKQALNIPFSEFNNYGGNDALESGKLTIDKVNSSLSSIQIKEYKALFDFYAQNTYERGYKGDQIEAEIQCAGGAAYDAFTVTNATYNDKDEVVTNATVQSSAVATPEFGAYKNGTLVNEGPVVYPTYLWNNYVNALAAAVTIAQTGNGDYAYKTSKPYISAQKDNYTAQVTDCYSADTDLQAAEIALEGCDKVALNITGDGSVKIGDDVYTTSTVVGVPDKQYTYFTMTPAEGNSIKALAVDTEAVEVTPAEDGSYTYATKVITDMTIDVTFDAAVAPTTDITISGRVTIANTSNGADSGFGLRGVKIMYGGELVDGKYVGGTEAGVTNAAGDMATYGDFTVTVPQGTTSIAIVGDTTIDRVVTLAGDADVTGAVIPVVMCDYDKDTNVNSFDLSGFLGYYSGEYAVCADFDTDGSVNTFDLSAFLALYNNPVVYDALTIA